MAPFHVVPSARDSLRTIACESTDGRQVRRAQALLGLDAGQRVSMIAKQLGVSRRTIQRWRKRYQAHSGDPIAVWLQDRPHPGRPAKQRKLVRRMIEQVWHRAPRHYGFRALLWTVPMLRCLFHKQTGQWVSSLTVRRAFRSLHYRYKRPRLVLALRHPAWRQAKGGLNAVFLGENAPSVCLSTRSFSTKFHRSMRCGYRSASKQAQRSWANIMLGAF